MTAKNNFTLSPSAILNHLSIQNRLTMLGILTIVGFSIFGGVYWFFSAKTDRAFVENTSFANTAKSVVDAQLAALKLQAIENSFLARKKPEIADQFNTEASKLSDYISSIQRKINNKKILVDLKASKNLLEVYKNGFAKVVKHQSALGFNIEFVANESSIAQSNTNLTVLFSNRAAEMEKRLSEEMEFGEASTLLPLMTRFYRSRQLAGDFLQSGNNEKITQFLGETNQFVSELNASDLDGDVKESMMAHLKKYETSVSDWSAEYKLLSTSSLQLGELSAIIHGQFSNIVRLSEKGLAKTSAQLAKMRSQLTSALLLTTLLSLAALLGLNLIISKSIIQPLNRMAHGMQQLSTGDTSIAVESTQNHEIGSMAKAVQVFRDTAIERRQLEQLSEQKHEKERQQQQAVKTLLIDFSRETTRIMAVLSEVTTKVQNTSATLTNVADAASSEANNAQDASSNASQNVQTVASATEQLASSIKEISRQSLDVTDVIEKSSSDIAHIDQNVNELSASAQKIGDVIGIISEIAEQTNLLALNATIEAARAGEAGAGFAVVAQEVKALADQTASATQEITTQIGSVQSSALSTANDIGGINQTMGEIKTLTATITHAVDQQDAATREIALSVATAANHTDEVSHSVSGVTSSINETAVEAAQILEVAKDLNRVQLELSDAMAGFTNEIASKVA